jgi:hypothetical protein
MYGDEESMVSSIMIGQEKRKGEKWTRRLAGLRVENRIVENGSEASRYVKKRQPDQGKGK